MKCLKQLAVAAGVVLTMSIGGWAQSAPANSPSASSKQTHKTSITIPESAQVGSSQLKPGDYKLQWEGAGPDVQVAFVQNGKTVATVPAKLVDKKDVPRSDAIVYKAGNGNSRTINEIDLAKTKQALILGGAAGESGE